MFDLVRPSDDTDSAIPTPARLLAEVPPRRVPPRREEADDDDVEDLWNNVPL